MNRSSTAELYALTHRGNPGDAAFYERFCAGATSILELGCGYGRLLAHLSCCAPRVVGVELDRALLALARKNVRRLPAICRQAIRLRQGDMRRFELGERFERVVLPYNGFFCLLSERDALACLRSVRAALADDGVFALDVWNADRLSRHGLSSADAQPLFSVEHGGRSWTVSEHTRVRARQRLEVRYDYRPARGVERSLTILQRYFGARELCALLARAGLRVRARYGDFNGAHFGSRSPQLVLTATRAARD
ncbi:MAG TPA: class I SAM-dependent methyltransferase [Polyangiaceae bacterium]|jgi:SAM-dependent methyltransferase